MLRDFNELIVILMILTIPIWLLARTIINLLRKVKGEKHRLMHETKLLLLFIYIVGVTSITIVPTHITTFTETPSLSNINFVPVFNTLKDISYIRQDMKSYMIMFWIRNVAGNVMLLLPMGIFLPLMWNKFRFMNRVVIAVFICSLSIEIIQFLSIYIGSRRSCDIDDIILNTLGGVIGFLFFKAGRRLYKKLRWSIN